MNSTSAITRRLIEVAPVLAAMAFHAIAFQRMILLVPVGLVLGWTIVFRGSISLTGGRTIMAGIVGLVAGMGMLSIGKPPAAPFPPLAESALTGTLIGVAILFTMAHRMILAWISAWILVALSGTVQPSTLLGFALIAFMVCQLFAAASLARTLKAEWLSVLAISLFAALVAVGTAGIVAAARQLDGSLQQTLQSWFVADSLSATTGLDEEIFVGSRSSITLSRTPVLELSDEPKRLRTRVLDRLDGCRWSTSSAMRTTSLKLADAPAHAESTRGLEMILLDDLGDILPSPAGIFEVRGAEPRVEGGWILRAKPKSAMVFLIGDEQERLPPEQTPGAELLAMSDELRAGLGPVGEQLMIAGETNREKAELVERFFQQHFTYTLDTDLVAEQHPLIVFVQQRRPAYCVYFASAMAVMLRTEGIPARMVTGFLPGEVNAVTGRVTIRERDAHAWVEAWSPEDQRFIAFDPTPQASREQVIGTARSSGILSALADAIGSVVRRHWLIFWRDPAALLRDAAKSPTSWIALAALLALLFRRRWTSHRPSTAAPNLEASHPLLRQSYRRYVSALRRAGVTPRPSETDDQVIARLADTCGPQLAAKATEFIAAYRRARYRGERADEHLSELARLE